MVSILRKCKLLPWLLLLQVFIYATCSSISAFDQYAYQQTTSVKVDALHVMDLGTEEFKMHEQEVKKVQLDMEKVYEYEKNRPKNEISTRMWQKLIDSTGALFGGFVNTWRSQVKCSPAYIVNKKEQISFAFDQIAELESRKIKPGDVK